MQTTDFLFQLKTVLPAAGLFGAWAAYLLLAAKWLRGVRRVQLFR